ncbi:MAG: hypothetical protein Ct9H300mP11_11070 [Chloroflexota bacterium]|nr:MAG: hypothetical protein Ct9H300mP11_11070 [Chloroflexota bacterium]
MSLKIVTQCYFVRSLNVNVMMLNLTSNYDFDPSIFPKTGRNRDGLLTNGQHDPGNPLWRMPINVYQSPARYPVKYYAR